MQGRGTRVARTRGMSNSRIRLLLHKVAGLGVIWLATSILSFAQTCESDGSWISTSQNVTANANPYRTTESHLKCGNRILEKKTVEVPGPDGTYQFYYRTEIETVQESPTLTRSTTRTYNPGGDRAEHLTQLIEVETRASDAGSKSVKTVSNANLDGKFEVKQCEISVTKKSSDLQKTQTTIYLPSTASEFAPSMQINEQQRRSADGMIETKKETLFPDFQGGWQTYEVREQTVRGVSDERITDERLSRRDFRGNVSPVSEFITKDTNVDGRASSTTQTYSVDLPGSARDSTLHPLESSVMVQRTEVGRIATAAEIVQPDTVEKGSNTVVKTTDIVVKGSSGSEETITVTAHYPDGYPSVVSVETRKTEGHH